MPFPDELERAPAVVAYRPEWPGEFERLADDLEGALGRLVVRVDHVGSTSVPGLAAKDCIDVQVLVHALDEAELVAAFEKIGFRCRPEAWNRVDVYGGETDPRLVFAPPAGGRSCNIHVRPAGAPNARPMLLFRDFLRANETARLAWGAFKARLAESVSDLFDYGQIKQPATIVLFEAAEMWAAQTGWRPGLAQLAPPRVSRDDLAEWCGVHLGAEPVEELFATGHLSQVVGMRLADGRHVVVKVRPPADRLEGCVAVQRVLWEKGFPCPEPVLGPTPLGRFTATAEALVDGGESLAASPRGTQLCARALRHLIALAPSIETVPTLQPPPPWAGWDHDQPGIWPLPDDRAVDLNAYPGPDWLDAIGERVRARLASVKSPLVVAHVDWEIPNVRWSGERLHAVHDWDSAAARPEAAIVGLAAAVHTASGEPLTEATDEQINDFLGAYEQARQQPFTPDERGVAWAAGLWVRAFNAKKDSLDGDGPSLARFAAEAPKRLELAGA